MKRLLVLLPALLLPTAVVAQEVPDTARKDLWCGIAFGIISAEAPADASDGDKVLLQQFAEGSTMLIERATSAHLAAGYDTAGFAAYKAEQEQVVADNMGGPEADYAFKYEDCAALIGL